MKGKFPLSPTIPIYICISLFLIFVLISLSYGQNPITGTVQDIDGNLYQTITIGNQWWMAENLNVSHYCNGDSIPQVQDLEQWINLTTGAWCYYENDPANGEKYGRLYNWYAVSDPRGLAPKGWHVPTDEDWKELEMALGMIPAEGDTQGWFGTDEGIKLKSTSGWNDNGNGSNSSGFSALPGAYRGMSGSFFQLGNFAMFWSSSDYGWDLVWYRALRGINSQIRRKLGTKIRGFSVRCVKD